MARTGLAVEKWFSFPQDIEWAFENGVLYLLQSRNVKNLSVAEVRAGA
jgi:pyruvate,water dikinase